MTPATIFNAIAQVFPVKPEDITGPSRRANETDARFCAALILRRYHRASNRQIARAFNRLNPSSGHYMRRRGNDLYSTDKQYRAMVNEVVAKLGYAEVAA